MEQRLTRSIEEFSNRLNELGKMQLNFYGGYYCPGQAYDPDIKLRIANLLIQNMDNNGFVCRGTVPDICSTLCVARSTVYQIYNRMQEYYEDPSDSNLIEISHGGMKGYIKGECKLDSTILEYIILIISQFPGLYMHEVSRIINENLDLQITPNWIRRTLHYCGYSRKKFSSIHQKRLTPENQEKKDPFIG